jgi:hypothetical protein
LHARARESGIEIFDEATMKEHSGHRRRQDRLGGRDLLVDTRKQWLPRHGGADRSQPARENRRDPKKSSRLSTLHARTSTNAFPRWRTAMKVCYRGLAPRPIHLTSQGSAEAARELGVHYLDLTEDVASTRAFSELAVGASTAFIPQCGLAPGFISIVAADLARQFDSLDSVRMRVGALPAYPSNALNYNLTWSTEGVINEYCEPCEAIVDGQQREGAGAREREEFSLDGVLYEAFNTSGGLGTLCETLAGKVRTLNYRTIRYPGHAAIMKALLHDLRLKDRATC